MSDIKNSVLPEIIEPISNAIQQNIPETAKGFAFRPANEYPSASTFLPEAMMPIEMTNIIVRAIDRKNIFAVPPIT